MAHFIFRNAAEGLGVAYRLLAGKSEQGTHAKAEKDGPAEDILQNIAAFELKRNGMRRVMRWAERVPVMKANISSLQRERGLSVPFRAQTS